VAAPPPLDIETQYQRLLEVLEGPVSGRWAVVQVDAFLARLGMTSPRVETYLFSLAEPLVERASQMDPVGLHPDRLACLAGKLREARQARAALKDCEALARAEQHLRRCAALLYGYAGAIEQAAEYLLPSSSPVPGFDLDERPPRARLRQARAQAEDTPLQPKLEWMAEGWEREADEGTHVPVVERRPSWVRNGGRDAPTVGALRRMAVQIYGSAERVDRIRAAGSVRGAEDSSLTDGAVAAARRLLEERFPRLEGQYVEGRVEFGTAETGHEGRSAGLALAVLVYGAVLEHAPCRTRVDVRPEVLLTGHLTPNGAVQPVGEDGLPVKVQTAFFSPKKRLVLPADQHEVAHASRDRLLEAFPHGQLDLVGIEQLGALFYDRRLTNRERIGWAQHAAQRLRDRRWPVAVGTLVLGLLAVIGMLLHGPINQNPASTRVQGSSLIIENDNGREVEEMEVGQSLVQKVKSGKVKRPATFADVTGNETKEIFWGGPLGEGARAHALRAKAVGTDTLLWERPLHFEVSFPKKPEVSGSSFGIADLKSGDFNRDGSPELYAIANHKPYFPALVLQLDPRTGRVEQRYVHPGHLRSGIATADVTGSPALELLVGGHSNAFGDPVLAVLRPTDIEGHAPTRGDYDVGGAGTAPHVAYLRFPGTAVQKQHPKIYPMIWQIRVASPTKTLEIVAQDGRTADKNSSHSKVISTLDYNLVPRSAGTDGNYDRLADSLVQHGVLQDVPGPEALRRYVENIQYWTGTGWTTEPTFIRRAPRPQ
jgi:hypothetical protein